MDKAVVFKKTREIFVRFLIIPPNGEIVTRAFQLRFSLILSILFMPPLLGNIFYTWRIISKDKVSSQSVVECLLTNIELITAAMTGYIGLNNINEILDLLHHLGVHEFNEPDGLAKVYEKQERISKYLYNFTGLTVFAKIALNVVTKSYCEAKIKYSDDRYICGSLLPSWFPFETNLFVKIWIFLSANLTLAIYIPIASLAYFIVYGVSDLIVLRMQKMEQMLREIDFRGNYKVVESQLTQCIEYHSEIWNLVEEMNNTIGWTHACQYFLISGIIGLLENTLIMYPSITEVAHFIIWIVGEFMICSAGQLIENEREAMAVSLYMTPWYKLPNKLRSTFTIFLAKMQMPLHMQAKPIIHLNYEFLMKVLKGSYSLLMFLQNRSM